MNIIIHKYGGTSLSGIKKIQNAALKVIKDFHNGYHVVVVVSAMSGTTNSLLSHCNDISNIPDLEEIDTLISSGEIITASLMSLIFKKHGIKSISLQGWQIPIITDNSYGNAQINHINEEKILNLLRQKYIPVITGFQGINQEDRITTLGRNGSDISALAISAALNSKLCYIYTDVDGIYTADPRIIPHAHKIDQISFDEMLEIAYYGTKALHYRAVKIAKEYNITTHVLSSFNVNKGTIIKNMDNIESIKVSNISYDRNVIFIKIYNKYNINQFLKTLTKEGINVAYWNENNILLNYDNQHKINNILQKNNLSYDIFSNYVLVSIIGNGIKNDQSIFHQILNLIPEFAIYYSGQNAHHFLFKDNTLHDVITLLHKELI